jgi:hypothetical protein
MKEINGLMTMEEQDFRQFCPSFYATQPRENVSDRYTFLNTRDIAMQLWGEGWQPTYAREARSIDPRNRGLTRHVIRWAHKDLQADGERIELVGVNSHNRAASFKFMAGIFRLVCSNGLITQTADFGSFSIRHVGDIADQVHQAIIKISGMAGQLAQRMDDFRAIELTPDEQGVFAVAAHESIYGPQAKPENSAPITAEQLLRPRRSTDAANGSAQGGTRYYNALPSSDLWTTFNVVQENATKGGLSGRGSTGRRMRTRQVTSIEKDVKLNQALWSLTEKMAELKTGEAEHLKAITDQEPSNYRVIH